MNKEISEGMTDKEFQAELDAITAAVPLSLLFYHGGKKMTRGKDLWKGIKLRESAGMIRRLRGHGWRRV